MDLAPFSNKKAKYRMIDLFAGIGGTRLGFHLTSKVKVVFSSEIDKFAKITYKTNFGEETEGDIREINSDKIANHEILVAGFPCQAFSQAGKKRGFQDERGTLFFEIVRILKDKKPKAFFLEDVKNLTTHNKGETFKAILNSLESINYHVTYSILKAKDFCLPQNRARVYIVGFREELINNY